MHKLLLMLLLYSVFGKSPKELFQGCFYAANISIAYMNTVVIAVVIKSPSQQTCDVANTPTALQLTCTSTDAPHER